MQESFQEQMHKPTKHNQNDDIYVQFGILNGVKFKLNAFAKY